MNDFIFSGGKYTILSLKDGEEEEFLE